MLKRACICVAILSFLVVMGLPLAQASTERRIKVNVPFDFYMRDRVLSAGEYEVREIATGILVRSADGSEQLIALTRDAAAQGRQAAGARLVFHRYGDQSFLAAAWMDESNGHQWRRVIVEKPFGHDLDSAKSLNQQLLKVANERQIYRIDHYLRCVFLKSPILYHYIEFITI